MSMKRFSLLIIVLTGFVFILRPAKGMASAPELEIKLFNKGYEYLFSYKPEQAAETFRIFLKEFPESSIRDAAMFWLGKTLISTKHYSEAELTFRTIQKEFPDSPFMDSAGRRQRAAEPLAGCA
ncbi:MAG: tetratricopeptide repeat protein [Nitrospirae bacterium]|nr:tetratricopeptide repeat protein [Nitrospirota bacterium]